MARRAWWHDHGTAASLVLLAVAGALWHAPWVMLRHPFWLDEAWVADSLRAPLSDLPRLTSSSPIGFTFLIRLVPTALGDERARLIPLLFSAALAPVTYLLGRELDREGQGTALLLGFTGVVFPAGMLRHDLKQYTADAFVAVTLLLLTARAERLRTPRAFARLTAAGVAGLLVSHTTTLVGGAVYAALVIGFATRRAWRPMLYAVAAGTVFVAAVGVDYSLVGQRSATPSLVHYWDHYYIPGDDAGGWIWQRAAFAAKHFGVGPFWLGLPILLLGVVALWAYGRRATALTVPMLTGLVILAAGLHAYPLWDERTALFYFALGTVVVVCGLAALARLATRYLPLLGALALGVVAAALVVNSVVLDGPLPDGDEKFVAHYIAAHERRGDLIVLDVRSAYQFAYYWRRDTPHWIDAPDRAVGFLPEFSYASGIRSVRDAAAQSGPRSLVNYVSASPTGTTWIVLSHNSKHASYLNAALELGKVEYLTDDRDYYLIKVTRRP